MSSFKAIDFFEKSPEKRIFSERLGDQPPPKELCSGMIYDLVTLQKYSLSRIAKRCGVSTSTVRKVLLGKTQDTTSSLFTKILILYCRIFAKIDHQDYLHTPALSWQVAESQQEKYSVGKDK